MDSVRKLATVIATLVSEFRSKYISAHVVTYSLTHTKKLSSTYCAECSSARVVAKCHHFVGCTREICLLDDRSP